MPSAAQGIVDAEPDQAARPSRLADGVYHGILSEIAGGTYGENQKLPSENDLAARYKVSRPVVRAALERLRREYAAYRSQWLASYRSASSGQAGSPLD